VKRVPCQAWFNHTEGALSSSSSPSANQGKPLPLPQDIFPLKNQVPDIYSFSIIENFFVGRRDVGCDTPVSLFRFFFSADLPPSLSLFLLLLPFLTVQVLLSTTGRTVAAGGGSGGCGRRPRWREKQREEQLLGTRKKDDFFLTLDPPSSFLRGTLCFFWYKLSAFGSTRKHPNHRLKVAKMNCQFCAGK